MITVEEVTERRGLRRFLDLGHHLHRGVTGWAPPVVALERAALGATADDGGAALLVRRKGRPVGRLLAWIDTEGREGPTGRFGMFECDDDPEAAEALVERAGEWVEGTGAGGLSGPVLPRGGGWGLRVEGYELGPATCVPWHPPRYGRLLERCGLLAGEKRRWFLSPLPSSSSTVGTPADPPPAAGFDGVPGLEPYRDPRIELHGVAAVPDVVAALGRVGVRAAWSAARAARDRTWDRCVVVHVDGDPAALVPGLCEAAGAAGYTEVLAPWAPPGERPVATQRVFGRTA